MVFGRPSTQNTTSGDSARAGELMKVFRMFSDTF